MSTTTNNTQEETNIDAEDPEAKYTFWSMFYNINVMVTELPGYNSFLCWYVPLQIARLGAAIAHVIVFYMIGQDFDLNNITANQHIALGFVGAVNIFGRLAPFYSKLAIDDLKECLQATWATNIVAKIFHLPHSTIIATPTGEVIQLIGKVFRNLDTILPAVYGAIFPVAVEVLVAFIFITCAYGWLGLIQLFLFLLYTYMAFTKSEKKAERNRELMKILIAEWGQILSIASSYERAHFFGNTKKEIASARECFDNIGQKMTAVFRNEHLEGMYLQFISLFITGGFVGILMFYIGQDINGIELVALAFYFVIFMGSLEQYAAAISNLRSGIIEYEYYEKFLNRESNIADVDDAIDLPLIQNPSIEFRNVSFSYEGKDILHDISFTIKGGETLGLVGPSGCGKSTIMRLLMRFYKVTDGVILIDGHDITKISGKSLRNLFSVVTQNAQLFNGTVRDNIGYGKLGSSDEDILRAAKMAELSFEDDSVEGITLDKEVGEGGQKLSGGQQQRVALARAMLKNGTIYLLDEPTTGLDGVVAEQLQRTLDSVSSQATTVCITHHLMDLKGANQIIYLDGGEIVERGSFADLLEQKGQFFRQIETRMSTV